MKTEIRDKWAEELESGKYKQGTGRLRNEKDERCCLDILCTMAVEAGVIDPPILRFGAYSYDPSSPDDPNAENAKAHWVVDPSYGEANYLPPKVQKWAGVLSRNPVLLPDRGNVEGSAGRANDVLKLTFAEIALLVRQLPGDDEETTE